MKYHTIKENITELAMLIEAMENTANAGLLEDLFVEYACTKYTKTIMGTEHVFSQAFGQVYFVK